MSEARLISPLLDGFALGGSISSHSGVTCYPAMPNDSDERYIVKTISVPASQVQVEALLLTGAFPDAEAAAAYFHELADGIRAEVEILDKLSGKRGFLPYQDCQIVPMEDGVGCEVYLLSRYASTLERRMKRESLTHLSAVNLGIDLCAAMSVCRSSGYLYVDLKPGNIFLTGPQEYRIGDLGFVALDSLEYAALPDRYRSCYIPPEISDAYSTLNGTMDTYALGLVLYQVYNNGKLPFDTEEERKALMERLAKGEALPAPEYADEEMAQIILKACAYDPADRWADPNEMGHALIGYMQRNGANDVPIIPPEPEEPEEEPVEEPVEEPTGESTPEEDAEAPAEEPEAETEEEPTEETPAEAETPEEVPEEEPAPEDWIDRMDAILSEDQPDEEPPADEPTLRELLDNEGYPDAEEVEPEELSDDTADMLNLAQELIEHETPEPVVAPEPIDVPIPEPIFLLDDDEDEDETPEPEAADSAEPGADASEGASEAAAEAAPEEAQPEAASDAQAAEPVSPESKPKKSKKLLGAIAALLVVALLGAGAWYYYNEYYLLPIDDITFEGDGLSLSVTVTTDIDQSLLTVVCKDNYGQTLTGKPENGVVTFTDLQPGTQYLVSLEAEGFHKLVNATGGSYTTPNQTEILDLTVVTGQTDGSAIVSFGVEGADSQEWTLTFTTEGEEPRTVTFTGHSVTLTDLTVGATYTITLEVGENTYLVGENTIEHTASAVILPEDLTVSGYLDGTITASWTAPEGVTVERWIARCYNDGGFDQILEVTEPSATFTGIAMSEAYTIEVSAANMTMSTRTFVTANPVTITSVSPVYVNNQLEVTWEFEGGAPSGGWVVTYSADGGTEQTITTTENKAVISLVAPSSTYAFSVTSADATTVMGENTASIRVPETKSFSANKLNTSNVSVKMYPVPDSDNWDHKDLKKTSSTFAPGESLALMYKTSKKYSVTDEQYTTLFVIRDSDGDLVSISSNTRSWSSMWTNGYCVEEVKNLPEPPGEYILDVYLNNQKLTRQTFTIE